MMTNLKFVIVLMVLLLLVPVLVTLILAGHWTGASLSELSPKAHAFSRPDWNQPADPLKSSFNWERAGNPQGDNINQNYGYAVFGDKTH